jgi:hypothetical protein
VRPEQRRAVLEGIIGADDPKVSGGDRLKALEQLERLEEQERLEELRNPKPEPQPPAERVADIDRMLAAYVIGIGCAAGHPAAAPAFPQTCAAVAEIRARAVEEGVKQARAEAGVRPVEGQDESAANEDRRDAARTLTPWRDVLPQRTGTGAGSRISV